MTRFAYLAAAALAAWATPAAAQRTDYSKVEEQVTDLGHGVYAMMAAGATLTIAVGTDGIIMVDSQYAPLHDKIEAAIAKISPLPVKYVINTHFHGDHTGGNALFRANGATIVAHETVVSRMTSTKMPADDIPNAPYTGTHTTVKVGGLTAEIYHPAPAHTDSDSVIIFPAADVIASGDLAYSTTYPNFDPTSGGNIDGMIAGANFIIAHSDDKTRIVPGNDVPTDKAGVIAYRDMLKLARDRIAKAKASGMTLDEVNAANPLSDLDAKWGKPDAKGPDRVIGLIYNTLPK